MAIVSRMNGIPLFSNFQEAVIWGNKMGVEGVHNHFVNNRTVYMAGINHDQIKTVMGITTPEVKKYIESKTPAVSVAVTPTTPTPPTPPTTGGGTTGGGGGY